MSIFFLFFTVITYGLSHLFAQKAKPLNFTSLEKIHIYQGNLQQFTNELKMLIQSKPQWLLLENTPNRFIISESPGAFRFGSFHHVVCKESEKGLEVSITTQAKLVGPTSGHSKFHKVISKQLELKNVG